MKILHLFNITISLFSIFKFLGINLKATLALFVHYLCQEGIKVLGKGFRSIHIDEAEFVLFYLFESLHGLFLNELRFFKLLSFFCLSHYSLWIVFSCFMVSDLRQLFATSNFIYLLFHDFFLAQLLIKSFQGVKLLKHT